MATATLNEIELPKLSNEEIARYSRHLILPEVGLEGQQKPVRVLATKVLCVGTGGLGALLALYLTAAGARNHRPHRSSTSSTPSNPCSVR